jgi:thymidylate synthase
MTSFRPEAKDEDLDIHCKGESTIEALKDAAEWVEMYGARVDRASGSWNMMKQSETTMIEAYNVTLVVTNPIARWHTLLTRGILLETLDYLLGLNPGYVRAWYPIYQEYSAVSGKMPYSYGERIFGSQERDINQWDLVAAKLKAKPTTRHGWLTLHRPIDRTRDFIPCTVDLYFQVNPEGHLDMFTYMRSQDIIRGLPMDLFAWTMFHEQMSLETDIPMGVYRHIVTNLHYYERDKKHFNSIITAKNSGYATLRLPTAPILSKKQKATIVNRLDGIDLSLTGDGKLTLNSITNFCRLTDNYWDAYVDLIEDVWDY